jgi:hypothetical protein
MRGRKAIKREATTRAMALLVLLLFICVFRLALLALLALSAIRFTLVIINARARERSGE